MTKFLRETNGIAALEFALILSIVGTVCVIGGEAIASSLDAWLTDLDAKVAEAKAVLAQIQAAGQ